MKSILLRMRIILSFPFRLFFYFNLHLSLLPIVWTAWVSILFQMEQTFQFYLFLFFSTQLIYTFDRFLFSDPADVVNVPDRILFIHPIKKLGLIWFLISLFFVMITSFFLSIENWLLFTVLSILTFSYLFLLKNLLFPEKIKAYLKVFLLSFVWSSILILSPLAQYVQLIHVDLSTNNIFIEWKNILNVIDTYFLLYLFIITILIFHLLSIYFDRRDVEGDIKTNKPNIHKYLSDSTLNLIILFIPLVIIGMNVLSYSIPIFTLIGLYYLFLSILVIKEKILFYHFNYDLYLDFPLFIFITIDYILKVKS